MSKAEFPRKRRLGGWTTSIFQGRRASSATIGRSVASWRDMRFRQKQPRFRPKPLLSAAQRTTDGMVRRPGGEFAVGDDSGDGYAADGEGPVRRVRVDSFWIDACVVSNADFAAFSAASGYVTDAERLTVEVPRARTRHGDRSRHGRP
jgi:formylglycine-generating enzyme required for sulfatase activity